MISGKQIYLSVLTKNSLNELFRWINDRELRRMSGFYDTVSYLNHVQWFQSVKASKHHRVFGIYTHKKILIGTTGLYDINMINRNAELRIRIAQEKFRGKGLGAEAIELLLDFGFQDLGLHKIWLQVFRDNLRAVGLYKKMQFRQEGLLKENAFVDGKFKDVLIMSRII